MPGVMFVLVALHFGLYTTETFTQSESPRSQSQIKTRPFEHSDGSLTHPFLQQLFSFEVSHDLSFPTPILSPSTSPITILDPIMSHLALSQVSLTTTVPAGSDLSLRRSVFKCILSYSQSRCTMVELLGSSNNNHC
ncbi:uncharacterized protein LOC133739673 [Rosa rugosa]|uniref:uncharacterized protein LOC133739673 n=1 Tax=Rosa rugosa TaxID=74645 RepID=UPI002B40A641|nr:uncharacterized protein LOC133739673 [Rosa rugosa]